ncbi:MAG: hypothetical protein IJ660_01675 [Alphaproteobacteria bacterium]|nr:hypothetical protein [Alphaproteobacteria bacterium]
MKSEYDIFLLWSTARYKDAEVVKLIATKFDIVKTYEIEWSQKLFIQNLSRFYGKKLPSAKNKLKLCGKGSFLVYIVKDNTPCITDNAKNQNMCAMKYQLRKLLGGNYLHASDNQQEAEENLYFLLGKSLRRLLAEPQPKKLKPLKQDIIGAPTWLDEDRFRKALKRVLNAVWDKDKRVIVCSDVSFACRILNARKCTWPWQKNRYKISIRGRDEVFKIKKHRI